MNYIRTILGLAFWATLLGFILFYLITPAGGAPAPFSKARPPSLKSRLASCNALYWGGGNHFYDILLTMGGSYGASPGMWVGSWTVASDGIVTLVESCNASDASSWTTYKCKLNSDLQGVVVEVIYVHDSTLNKYCREGLWKVRFTKQKPRPWLPTE